MGLDKSTLDFLKKLKKNNTREWFDANRSLYTVAREDFSGLVGDFLIVLSKFDNSVRSLAPKDCIFRLNRDVRFSANKSPYKTNFGAFIVPGGKNSGGAGYYLHLAPGGNSFFGGGCRRPPGPTLARIRTDIDEDAAPLRKILKSAAFKKRFGGLVGEQVKTAPRGYTSDHPAIELLRYKSYIVSAPLTEGETLAADFAKKTVAGFKLVAPLVGYLNEVILNGR